SNSSGSGLSITVQAAATAGTATYRVFNITGTNGTLENMTIRHGKTNELGGGIYINTDGTVDINSCTVSNNYSQYGGGVSISSSSTANIDNSSIINNNSTLRGGGIYAEGILNLTNSTVSENSAHDGGGIWNGGSNTDIVNSTVTNNIATGTTQYGGGGVVNASNIDIVNSTVTGNTTLGPYGGGGILNYSSTMYLLNTIVTNNTASSGGDITNYLGTLNAYYTWYNNAYGTVGGSNNNTTSYTASDLSALGYNGGFTNTPAVASAANTSSKAGSGTYAYYNSTDGYYFYNGSNYTKISNGSTFTPSDPASDKILTDQRGYHRIEGDVYDGNTPALVTSDITRGAYQYNGVVARTNIVDNWTSTSNNYYSEIQGAENHVSSGSTVKLTGTAILISSQIYVSQSITLDGAGMESTIARVSVPGTTVSRVFNCDASGQTINISNMTIKGGDISSGGTSYPDGAGGAIYFVNGTLNLSEINICNSNAYYGGALCVWGDAATCNLSNSTLKENNATSKGGAIRFTRGTLFISNTTIDNNTSSDAGGAIAIVNLIQNCTIKNSTFYNNTSYMDAGAISTAGAMTIENVTIAENHCGASYTGGGLYLYSGTISAKNNIIANNYKGSGTTTSNDYYYRSGTLTDNGYNIIEDQTGASTGSGKTFTAATNITGQQANLFGTGHTTQTLADNGGPTLTLAIESGSVAISAGVWDASITADQRGESRREYYPTIGACEPADYSLTWTGNTDTDWGTPANWTPAALPILTDNLTIPDVSGKAVAPIISQTGTADCHDLSIESGGSLTIQSGSSGTGSLITTGTITNNGTVDIQRYLSESAWHLISVPNNVTTANTFLGDYLQSWDESTATWTDIEEPTTVLNPTQGYALWGTPGKATTYTFTGTPLTGDQSEGFSYTIVPDSAYDGANLLGNPYPSVLDWDLVIAGQTGLNNAVYCYNSITGNYVSYVDGVGDCRYIPSMQGFMVMATANGTFNLNNDYRVHNGAAYYKVTTEKENYLRLSSHGNGLSDKLHICFNSQASETFDGQYDAYKFFSGNEKSPQLYTFSATDVFSIDQRPQCELIQLGFKNGTAGIYDIKISEINHISEALLEDTKTNTFHDLTKGSYEFAWDISDNEKRFKLHLNAVGIEENQIAESNILIYSSGQEIHIKGADAGKVLVMDIMGRTVLEAKISGSELITIPANLQTGVYVVMVRNGKDVKTEKIFIR
nr:T9SS type A sorting domain-containing protein [Bacteroidota bacterium]